MMTSSSLLTRPLSVSVSSEASGARWRDKIQSFSFILHFGCIHCLQFLRSTSLDALNNIQLSATLLLLNSENSEQVTLNFYLLLGLAVFNLYVILFQNIHQFVGFKYRSIMSTRYPQQHQHQQQLQQIMEFERQQDIRMQNNLRMEVEGLKLSQGDYANTLEVDHSGQGLLRKFPVALMNNFNRNGQFRNNNFMKEPFFANPSSSWMSEKYGISRVPLMDVNTNNMMGVGNSKRQKPPPGFEHLDLAVDNFDANRYLDMYLLQRMISSSAEDEEDAGSVSRLHDPKFRQLIGKRVDIGKLDWNALNMVMSLES